MPITIFSVPKPFDRKFALIQRNAIGSWRRVFPGCQIVLIGNEPGVAEICAEWGLTHIPDVQCNDYGTPLVNGVFSAAMRVASNDVMMYINADIIALPSLREAVNVIGKSGFVKYLAIGQRWNLDVDKAVDYDRDDWEAALVSRAKREGKLFLPFGLDYFVFPKALFADVRMPAFALGRFCWDNWLVNQALLTGDAVIDCTRVVMAVHQNHDYSHVEGEHRGEQWQRECAVNRALIADHPYVQYASVKSANYVLDQGGIRQLRPLVSLVIKAEAPDRNLRAVILSAISQTYTSAEEIVVVHKPDDLRTPELVRTFRTNRVRTMVQEWDTLLSFRNSVWPKAEGKYIIWLDNDTAVMPGTVKRYLQVLAAYPAADILYGDLIFAEFAPNIYGKRLYRDHWQEPAVRLREAAKASEVQTKAMMIAKAAYQRLGGYKSEGVDIDAEFISLYARHLALKHVFWRVARKYPNESVAVGGWAEMRGKRGRVFLIGYDPLRDSIGAIAARSFALQLSRRGFDVIMVDTRPVVEKKPVTIELNEYAYNPGIGKVRVVHMTYYHDPLGAVVIHPKADAMLRDFFRLVPGNVVHFISLRRSIPLSFLHAAKESGMAVYASIGTSDFLGPVLAGDSLLKTQRVKYARLVLQRVDGVRIVPLSVRKKVSGWHLPSLEFDMPGVPKRPLRLEWTSLTGKFNVLPDDKRGVVFAYFGSISDVAGVGRLVKAFMGVKSNARLLLWGAGEISYVSKLLRVFLKQDPRIEYCGEYFGNTFDLKRRDFHVLVVPRVLAGWKRPSFIDEPIPVVAPDFLGKDGQICDRFDGWLFSDGVSGLARVIRHIADNPAEIAAVQRSIDAYARQFMKRLNVGAWAKTYLKK